MRRQDGRHRATDCGHAHDRGEGAVKVHDVRRELPDETSKRYPGPGLRYRRSSTPRQLRDTDPPVEEPSDVARRFGAAAVRDHDDRALRDVRIAQGANDLEDAGTHGLHDVQHTNWGSVV